MLKHISGFLLAIAVVPFLFGLVIMWMRYIIPTIRCRNPRFRGEGLLS